jgi:putative redox protein
MVMNRRTIIELDQGDAMVTAGGHRFHVVPHDRSGADAGCPVHLLEGALGACIALTLDAVARNKGIPVADIRIGVERQPDGSGGTRFAVGLELSAGLTDRERKILQRSAQLCDVGRILKGDVQIDYHFSTD